MRWRRRRAMASSSNELVLMNFPNPSYSLLLLALLGGGLAGYAWAASTADWEGCSAIPADAERLACYDRVSGRSQLETAPRVEAEPAPQPAAAPPLAPLPEPRLH